MIADLTLFNHGTIARLQKQVTPTSPKKKPFHPLDLPQVKGQCVHVEEETEELSEGIEAVYRRCVKNADKAGRHGFLCKEHKALLDEAIPVRRAYRDYDGEVVKGIINTESRALDLGTRERVRVCKDTYITYLTS